MIGASILGRSASRTTSGRGYGFDFWLVVAAALLLVVGVMAIYSEGYGKPGGGYFRAHLLRLAIGVIPFLIFFKVDPQWWRRAAVPLYILNLALLALVIAKGSAAKGAQRWLELGPIEFQPSEMSKLIAVLAISAYYANRARDVGRFSTFFWSFLYILPTLILVFKQPHLGATLVILVAWLSVSIFAQVPWKYIIGMFAAIAAALVMAWNIPGILQPYQKERILAMFVTDDQDKNYQQLRASIAFAEGGVSGTGFLKGEQKAGRFIPEQHTDFIFSVIGEEGGLIGCSLVLAAYAFFFFRGWLVMYRADDPFLRMLAAGVVSILAFHTIVNLAMNLQIAPVVGLWLPFMSYGGTALWLCMACVGLLLNLSAGSRNIMFSTSDGVSSRL